MANNNTTFSPCIIIPCYKHGKALANFLPALAVYGYPIIIIDDGNTAEEAALLQKTAQQHHAKLIRHPQNLGKMAAMLTALRAAQEQGYSHALQCDADGQHDPTAIPRFFHLSQQHPSCIIAGTPQYGDDVPAARLHGRKITTFFIAVETLGKAQGDGMCGFRVYPIAPTLRACAKHRLDTGMAGDIQILVITTWRGIRSIAEPVNVSYPEGGHSNFHMLRDNCRISWAHTRLCTYIIFHPWLLLTKASK